MASQGKSKATLSDSGDILIENFDLTFGACQLMQDAELKLSKGKRYGLVGRNGAGKSTLLRALHRKDHHQNFVQLEADNLNFLIY